MARLTIDYGIDLGTTNSEIACLDTGTIQVFKNYLGQEHTPSVVRINSKGERIIGRKAYEHLEDDPDNVVSEFKRWMGTAQTKDFAASRQKLTSDELSSEVLKSLKADVLRVRDEDIRAAVITVPALFELVQCEATQRAAKMAGIEYSPLLQEPIAAAMAYGFGSDSKDAYWMVYDLGGGTFDVSIVSVIDKRLSVVEHYGDNHLGGKDFDWKIVDDLLVPHLRNEFDLPELARGPKKYRKLIAKLKILSEEAKIELSQRASTLIEINHSESGLPDIEASIEVKRKDYERLIDRRVCETIALCRQALKNKELQPSAIERIILVGGPTLTPYIREALKSDLGVPLEFKVDPLTVVAQGAAVFASSQKIADAVVKRDAKKLQLKLAYNPLTSDAETVLGGKFEKPLGPGHSLQIERSDGGWQSGRLDLGQNGFVTTVALREGKANLFSIKLFNQKGDIVACEPSEVTITNGLSLADPPLSRSIGVEIEDGMLSVHLKKGTSVPCKKKEFYRSVRSIKPGEGSDFLNIHVYEGEYRIANRNRHLGTLKLSGKDLKRPLPENAELEVTISVDASRIPTAKAYIPLLDQTVEHILTECISPKPDLDALEQEIILEQQRAQALQEAVQKDESSGDVEESKGRLSELNVYLTAAKGGDQDAAEHVQRKLQDVKSQLDDVQEKTRWPRLVAEYEEICKDTSELISERGSEEEKERLALLKKEGQSAIGKKDTQRLIQTGEELSALRMSLLFKIDDFWIAVFQNLASNADRFKGDNRAKELLREGGQALQRQDMDALRSVTGELWGLLSKEEQSVIGKTSDAGIRKA